MEVEHGESVCINMNSHGTYRNKDAFGDEILHRNLGQTCMNPLAPLVLSYI